MSLLFRRSLLLAALGALAACGAARGPEGPDANRMDSWTAQLAMLARRPPDTIPTRWQGLLGEYGPDTTIRWIALERDGRMYVLDHQGNYVPLAETSESVFQAPVATAVVSGEVRFQRDSTGRAQSVQVADMVMARRAVEPPPGATQLRVTPVRPLDEIRREALAATPPVADSVTRNPDLVDITRLDSTIRLDIRYAGTNNFLGAPLYEQPRALLQRPAAEALARANRVLRQFGYALLVHDAYRPWYVTKIFWEATPPAQKWLVANAAQGSKHNRGAAVDLTLYDLEARRPVAMPSTYDEATVRARADYPGGTSLQRHHREILRRVMVREGFVVNPTEWWHFDYKDWKSYPILNVPFAEIR
ncbi:MAG TPA: M15 family metallopeptidase [Gemmatimonadaceae bacterium]|nr:M15 family metallopeptidase [Gemmatimonadaceae bacterium]